MALKNNKSPFSLDVGERMKPKTPTPAYTHTDTHTDTYTAIVENKEKRTYGLVKQSVFDKVTAHAKATGTSYNAIVCKLLDEYIEKNNL